MLIGSRQRISTFNSSPSLTINDVPVKQVSHTKSLGVHIDENLTWNVHIEKLCKKVASGIGALKRIRPLVPPSTMQLIYNCLVQPYFDCCCVVWDSCGSINFKNSKFLSLNFSVFSEHQKRVKLHQVGVN